MYATTPRECLEVVWEVLKLRGYLEGAWLTVRTDHDELGWILNMADATGKLEIWILRLSEYELDLVHCDRIKNQTTEALSRLPTSRNEDGTLYYGAPVMILGNGDTQEEVMCD